MRQIQINRIILTNFLSFKEECVSFSNSIGLKLLAGSNKIQERLGANGAGKSSLWRAVQWCFFGDERVSQILSWGEKSVEVLVELQINNVIHTVYRCGPPMKLELNSKIATQEDVNNLLGLTEERFKHSVIFGQGVRFFPDLSIPERGQLLDDVLQLSVWQDASERATKAYAAFEHGVKNKQETLAYVEGQISQLESEEVIQKRVDDWDVQYGVDILQLTEKKEEWDTLRASNLFSLKAMAEQWKAKRLEELQSAIHEMQNAESQLILAQTQLDTAPPELDTIQLESSVKKADIKISNLKHDYTKLDTQRSLVVKPRTFWVNHSNCPTCLQSITEEQRQDHLRFIDEEEKELICKLEVITKDLEVAKKDFEQAKTAFSFVNEQINRQMEMKRAQMREVVRLEALVKANEKSAEKIVNEVENNKNPFEAQINVLEDSKNPYITQLETNKKKKNPYVHSLDESRKTRSILDNKRRAVLEEVKEYEKKALAIEYWKHGFKRIRLYFINKILAALQIEIKSAMSGLGLDMWQVQLATEVPTKSETLKLGVQIKVGQPNKDMVEISAFSGGESQRLKLAVALGLGSLIQRSAGSFWNFEVHDEPGQHLSEPGMEDLLDVLAYRADILKKRIYITHHSALTHSAFSEIWMVTKDQNGSKVTQVQ